MGAQWNWCRFFPIFFGFPVLIIIPPLLHPAHFHILGLLVGGCISDVAIGSMQSKDVYLLAERFRIESATI
jgi:hypothetical protein